MEKMRQLQECRDEEEASQEEMASRFEIEKRESMFVFSSGKSSHSLYSVSILLTEMQLNILKNLSKRLQISS